jgi:hypothetical protein
LGLLSFTHIVSLHRAFTATLLPPLSSPSSVFVPLAPSSELWFQSGYLSVYCLMFLAVSFLILFRNFCSLCLFIFVLRLRLTEIERADRTSPVTFIVRKTVAELAPLAPSRFARDPATKVADGSDEKLLFARQVTTAAGGGIVTVAIRAVRRTADASAFRRKVTFMADRKSAATAAFSLLPICPLR